MIICPSCRHSEYFGAIFCSECGSQLVNAGKTPMKFGTGSALKHGEGSGGSASTAGDPKNAPILLNVCGTDVLIPLMGQAQFTLGRIGEGQPILPDIDLSRFDAYDYGVSRLHASLRIEGEKVLVHDLGSANGTKVNDHQVSPHTEIPVNDGDTIILGKLKLQIVFRK